MATRMEVGIWRAAWAKPETFKLAPRDFQLALESGASPWVAPSKSEPFKTLVGALSRSHHSDLGLMLSMWIRAAGSVVNAPPGHPPVLSCIPLDGSVSAVEKLVAGGADASGPHASAALFQKALDQPEAFESDQFWDLADHLLGMAPASIAGLAPLLSHTTSSLFEAITKKWPPEKGSQVLVRRGGWDFAWKESPEVCRWICAVLASGDVSPELLSETGFDWSGVDENGNTIAHHLVMDPRYASTGKPLLPIQALVGACDRGLTLREQNAQQWSVMQRIRALSWENEDECGNLFSRVDANRLQQSTDPALGRSSGFRL